MSKNETKINHVRNFATLSVKLQHLKINNNKSTLSQGNLGGQVAC